MKKRDREISITKKTTVWDFLIALGNGIVNLMKIDKIICIVILYLIGRDFFFTKNIANGEIYQKNVLDASYIIEKILDSDSKDYIYLLIILVLLAIVIVLIMVIKYVYKPEILRLVKERNRLMHDIRNGNYTPLKEHNSSEWEDN